jgi:hypothetical protein
MEVVVMTVKLIMLILTMMLMMMMMMMMMMMIIVAMVDHDPMTMTTECKNSRLLVVMRMVMHAGEQ